MSFELKYVKLKYDGRGRRVIVLFLSKMGYQNSYRSQFQLQRSKCNNTWLHVALDFGSNVGQFGVHSISRERSIAHQKRLIKFQYMVKDK